MPKNKRPIILYNIKLDRNEPCYCGSGKKYKQCCLENPKPNARELIDYYYQWKDSRVVNRLCELVIGELPEDLRNYFLSVYIDNPFLFEKNVNLTESDEWQNYHSTQIMNTTKLYIYDALVSGSEHVEGFKEFILEKADEEGLSKKQLDYMLKIAGTKGSFFLIEKTDPENISSEAQDIFTKRKITIIDRGICRSCQAGDILFGKPVSYKPEKNQYVLEVPGISSIHFSHEKWIFKCFEDVIKQVKRTGEKKLSPEKLLSKMAALPVWIITAHMWLKTHPEVTNFSGENLRFLCATFTFENTVEVMAQLESIKGMEYDNSDRKKISMIWFDSKTKVILASLEVEKNLLKVYLNSQERFKKFEKIANKIPGLKLRDIKEESLKNAIKSSDKKKSSQARLSSKKETKAEIQRYIQDHYKKWADEKNPALGNKKPRELVKTPEGRKKVEMMIEKFERDYAAIPENELMYGIRLDFLRKDLGI